MKKNFLHRTILIFIFATLTLFANGSNIDFLGLFKKRQKADTTKVVKPLSEYQKITNSKNLIGKGLFKIYKQKDNYYFEIPQALLKKDMLVINKLQEVPNELNEAGVNRGVNYQNQVIRFEYSEQGKKLYVRQQRPLPLSPKKDKISTAVRENYISPYITALKPIDYSKDSTAILVKVNDLYNGNDISINNVFSNINLGTSAIPSLSNIQSVKAFWNNVVATSELTTKVREGMSSVNVTVFVSSTILLLPDNIMRGRNENQRVGYFTNSRLSYSDKQQRVETKNYITRWRLEPKSEDITDYMAGKLVEPKKPIIFYLDNSIPTQWRKYLKKGVEDWQVAFEKAGFKNAIKAIEMNDSIAAIGDDVNYSTLTYVASQKANAMGPSITDPRSGEILEADIIWWHNVVSMLQEWIRVQTGAVNVNARGNTLPDSLMGDAMRFVACHEVGHSLGLRHNMIASAAYPTDSLRSKTFTDRVGNSAASIMDYARFNYIAQPGDNVSKMSPHIGAYDKFAIEYGYRWYPDSSDENSGIQSILDNHKGKLYRYSEAQDVRDAIDPRAQTEDLGDDAIKSSELGIKNLKIIVPQIVKWTTDHENGQTYEAASRLYYSVINQWNNYLYHVLANVGGIYIENTTVGDGQKTFTHVEKEKQKAAVQFLLNEVLTTPKWLFNSDISNYFYLWKKTPNGVVENAPTQVLKNAQAYILWDMLLDTRIMRMLENEYVNKEKAFTAVEMLDMLHNSIFKITERGGKPDVMQRSLQKNFVDALINAASYAKSSKDKLKIMDKHFLMNDNCNSCKYSGQTTVDNERTGAKRTLNFYGVQIVRTSDAISVKRGELLRIKSLLEAKQKSAKLEVKYHYMDLILRINTALNINR